MTELDVDVVVLELAAVVETKEESLYSSRRSPAPQYWNLLPGQMKLQSPSAALVEAGERVLPQKPAFS